jgi:glycosyltransferase involved in cell wall biosynthesis
MKAGQGLALATVTKSLVFQSPHAWDILRNRGFELTFAARFDEFEELLRPLGTTIDVSLDRRRLLGSARASSEIRSLAAGDWDFVQLQSPIAAALWRALVSHAAYPTLYVAHGLHVSRGLGALHNAFFGSIEHVLHHRTDAIALVTDEDFQLAKRWRWGRHALVWRLPGAGVDVDAFARGARPVKPEFSTAVFCGELNANKDITFALAVADALRQARLIDSFLVLGDGPQRDRLASAMREGWVRHIPFSTNVPEHLSTAAVLLHTSHREGLPRVVIEGHASGVPVLARDNRGSRELVVPGTGQVLPRSATVDDWVAAARIVLAGEYDQELMLDRAHAYGLDRFAISYNALVDAVLAGPAHGYVDLPEQP